MDGNIVKTAGDQIRHCFLDFCPLRLNSPRVCDVERTQIYSSADSSWIDSLYFRTMRTEVIKKVNCGVACCLCRGQYSLFECLIIKKNKDILAVLLFKIKGCGDVCVLAKPRLP